MEKKQSGRITIMLLLLSFWSALKETLKICAKIVSYFYSNVKISLTANFGYVDFLKYIQLLKQVVNYPTMLACKINLFLPPLFWRSTFFVTFNLQSFWGKILQNNS